MRDPSCAWHEAVHGSLVPHTICLDCADAQVAAYAAASRVARLMRMRNLDDARPRLGESAVTAARSAARRDQSVGAGLAE